LHTGAANAIHGSVCPCLQERTILQFGKVADDVFTMDFSYPMTALQVGASLAPADCVWMAADARVQAPLVSIVVD
jgi:hypothetical protein